MIPWLGRLDVRYLQLAGEEFHGLRHGQESAAAEGDMTADEEWKGDRGVSIRTDRLLQK